MSGCAVVTYNVKGLDSPPKTRKKMDLLKQINCKMPLLKLMASTFFYFSHTSGQMSGVAVLIHM